MLKKIIMVIFFVTSILCLFACDKQTIAKKDNWKIGIMTSTTILNEDEYRAAENVIHKFGEEHVIHITFPDKFMSEQETMIDKLTLMASDTDVKGIIISQGVPGITEAIDKIKETRKDILIIVCSSGDEPSIIASKADIVLCRDIFGEISEILDISSKQGAKTFVHYSFPRHMSYDLFAKRRDLLKEGCQKLGIEFIEVITPDPAEQSSISDIHTFIVEDVSKKVEKYGRNTAFFTTNQSIESLLISAVVDYKAIYSSYRSSSPYNVLTEKLGIKVPEDKKGDIDYLVEQVKKSMAKEGMKGNTSTWPVHPEMMFIEAGSEYIKDYIDGNTKSKLDLEKIKKRFSQYAGNEIEIKQLEYEGKKYNNYIIIISDYAILKPYI